MRTRLRFICFTRPVWGLLRQGGYCLMLVLASGLSARAQCFQEPQNFGVGINPRSVAIGDLNRDGKADLATANHTGSNVSVLLGVVVLEWQATMVVLLILFR